jgi:tetratricopeptide (TPR) repeat protein
MKCKEFNDLIESYLRETIDESKREGFEEHFFQCRKCFLGLKINEALQNKDVRISLAEEKPRRFAFKVLRPILVMSSLFLLILFSVLLLEHGNKARKLQELADFELPLYHQGELRGLPAGGTAPEREFARAMRLYQDRDFRSSLAILEQAPLAAATSPKVEFFRAICYLEENQAQKAGEILDAIIREMDPAYFDDALYYKGFVLLRQGRLTEARLQFGKLAAMLSPMAGKAQAMVRKIGDL